MKVMRTDETPPGDSTIGNKHSDLQIFEVSIVSRDRELATLIASHLNQLGGLNTRTIISADELLCPASHGSRALVYLPTLDSGNMAPDLSEGATILSACKERGVQHCLLVSSAAVYGASFRNPGLVSESYRRPNDECEIATQWRALEDIAKGHFNDGNRLTILRCATVLSQLSANTIARRFMRRTAVLVPGHDPSIQLMAPSDLAQAIGCLLQTGVRGVFNVAPDETVPFSAALKLSGVKRISIPRTVLRALHTRRRRSITSHLNYVRYSWTISNEKLKAIGFRPEKSSAAAVREFRRGILGQKFRGANSGPRRFDDFGMDKEYIARYGRTLFHFLADWYWRIEAAGLENIPAHGRAVLAGVHRGFMPWDGVMALDLIVKNIGRYPRFLIHPGLVKFPFLANFMTKLGGVIACQENAQRILESDELLGVFPEGIQGAFVRYSDAYRIHDFHRDAFVKVALRHHAPIIPFVTVGSAEIFPILGKLKSHSWTRYSEWPAIPITPTFPLIPLPLPSKWHTRVLPAMHVESDYPPSAAANPSIVRAISREVKQRMQNAIDEMLQRRRSVFFGSIFAVDAK
jgi:1-acyl-sn-glycerol-3-phosphate acyltransferase